ncbi:hypothetical protein PsYK624_167580 [Phanerochaete sordida]|uniref:Uncharacterized protein n=1 Tax=Phanerochaete sordida TaxID=48140 RepID=A0A9P3GTJ1_9APHY|nr:hypothetical protein PsYK624_167580 [Phanerochaete sordida]
MHAAPLSSLLAKPRSPWTSQLPVVVQPSPTTRSDRRVPFEFELRNVDGLLRGLVELLAVRLGREGRLDRGLHHFSVEMGHAIGGGARR